MFVSVRSAVPFGVEAIPVQVEVDVAVGLASFTIVGASGSQCREVRDRVRAAVLNAGLTWPQRRVTVSTGPRRGSSLDLAIAVAVLAADGQIPAPLPTDLVWGELGLDGTIRPAPGVVEAALLAPIERIVCGSQDAVDATAGGDDVWPVGYGTLADLAADLADGSLAGGEPVRGVVSDWSTPPDPDVDLDMSDVVGYRDVKWALEVAAAGGHNVLMVGPEGAGATAFACRMPTIMGDLTSAHQVEVDLVRSAAGLRPGSGRPPYRAPHPASTLVALLGGGTAAMRPGEISLAHRGVLFLDDVTEFPVAGLDGVRSAMAGTMRVARGGRSVEFPSDALVVAVCRPCPCGDQPCQCSPDALARWRRRIPGPFVDRLSIRVRLGDASPSERAPAGSGGDESSAVIRERVVAARARAVERQGCVNERLIGAGQIELTVAAADRLSREIAAGSLSARGADRVRRVALTIADLAGHDGPLTVDQVEAALGLTHLNEAREMTANA